MHETDQLIATIKRQLKLQGLTYRDLAGKLGLAEPSVKRLFASGRLTLERLADIARVLGFTLAELTHEAAQTRGRLHLLDAAQERELVADEQLLLVAVCVLNHWTVADITRTYALTVPQIVVHLARLDRLRMIDLLPGDRVRLNVARDFDWLPQGPIRMFFLRQGMGEFLGSPFDADTETLAFSHAMLTPSAVAMLQAELRKLRQRLAELHDDSRDAPLAERHGVGLLCAMRDWEPAAFTALRR
ncbi:helix-turn-helix domain-containing protein [Jeongeupia naejangsanensis]|uniref:Helix-turn-helix transcriptional regulator n=1 Tax=Jeongeupia naejangsanensis TaxID=613195 RepID=A0ABS2BR01_9NEIS|nr:helix-turn-helix transcriptional regulator [Jeongeupia naejangsanensis]MBM3117865.1 helix-turn-helix transcriptional regulator [Jeongeupia naejangsanensis]